VTEHRVQMDLAGSCDWPDRGNDDRARVRSAGAVPSTADTGAKRCETVAVEIVEGSRAA
jgi:hypothetical protein